MVPQKLFSNLSEELEKMGLRSARFRSSTLKQVATYVGKLNLRRWVLFLLLRQDRSSGNSGYAVVQSHIVMFGNETT